MHSSSFFPHDSVRLRARVRMFLSEAAGPIFDWCVFYAPLFRRFHDRFRWISMSALLAVEAVVETHLKTRDSEIRRSGLYFFKASSTLTAIGFTTCAGPLQGLRSTMFRPPLPVCLSHRGRHAVATLQVPQYGATLLGHAVSWHRGGC